MSLLLKDEAADEAYIYGSVFLYVTLADRIVDVE
jgi:hypothetical protein